MLNKILGLDSKSYNKIVPALFAYLFNRIDLERFIDFVGDQKEGTRIKDIARQNGYVLKNCKLYAYMCYYNRCNGIALPRASEYEVDKKDSLMLRRLNLKHLNTKVFRAFTLAQFDATMNHALKSRELRDYIGKFVTKKMTFLMKSYGVERHDIETHLQEMAIIALYKQYPRYQTHLHFINVAKAQIHNKGQTYITSMTSKSRQRLQQNDQGQSEAVHVDIETLNDVASPIDYGAAIKEQMQALTTIEHMLPERTREFLMCAAGQYHEGLSSFMQINNELAAEAMTYGKYMNKVMNYFETSPDRIEKLFTNIRARIYRTSPLGG